MNRATDSWHVARRDLAAVHVQISQCTLHYISSRSQHDRVAVAARLWPGGSQLPTLHNKICPGSCFVWQKRLRVTCRACCAPAVPTLRGTPRRRALRSQPLPVRVATRGVTRHLFELANLVQTCSQASGCWGEKVTSNHHNSSLLQKARPPGFEIPLGSFCLIKQHNLPVADSTSCVLNRLPLLYRIQASHNSATACSITPHMSWPYQ